MKMDKEIAKDTIKLGIAIAAVAHPAVAFLEPGADLISQIIQKNQSLFSKRLKVEENIKTDLKGCIKKTLKAMKKESSADTQRRAVSLLEPYMTMASTNYDNTNVSANDLETLLGKVLTQKEISAELYCTDKDIKYLIEDFYKKFNIFILDYPTLSQYYNQQSIEQNRNAVQCMWGEFERFKKQYFCSNITFEELTEMLYDAFRYEQKNNPGIKNIQFSNSLLPRLDIEKYSITANINKEQDHVLVQNFLNKTWQEKEQNHISITGIGGIGKTVALFNMEYRVPAVYVPLRGLAVSQDDSKEEYITRYIKENTLNGSREAFEVFTQFCNQPWENGPRVILLLDGLNEVNASKLQSIKREIETKWARKEGLQVILTSRYDINTKIKLERIHQVLIEPLSKETICKHLERFRIEPPDEADCIWKIIDTPLMLMLYTRSEQIKTSHDNEFANWREPQNGGSIIWNYMQSELCKADIHNLLEGIVAIQFSAPWICYKMMVKNEFSISEEAFKNYVNESIDCYQQLEENQRLPGFITNVINEIECSQVNKKHFYNLLTKNFNIFSSRNNCIQLVHQHFRDCLAAIYIMQTADHALEIPKEWKKPFDQYVMEFITDLLITERVEANQGGTWQNVWKFGYQKESGTYEFTRKMLELYKKAYGTDISQIDFREVDLTKVPLGIFRLTAESKGHFKNAIISRSTFFGEGHTATVCATSWCCDEKSYMTASYDCNIRIYDAFEHTSTILKRQHKHYIRCAKFSPVDANIFASAGDDRQLIIWKADREKNIKWNCESWGECSNWIRTLAWDNAGRRIACADASGNITLFEEKKMQVFKHVHKRNTQQLAWSKDGSSLASGDDDGFVCIWSDKGVCKKKIKLESAVTSVAWLQNDRLLMISTANVVYFYKILCKSGRTNRDSVQMCILKKKETKYISYITVNNKDDMDYIAIFYNDNLEILSITFSKDHLNIDCIGLYHYNSEVNRIASAEWNRDCNRLICGSRDGSVSYIDVLKNEEDKERFMFHVVGRKCNMAVRCSSWSSNGKWLAAGYDDCRIRIWNPFKKRCLAVLTGHIDSVKCLSWSPDSRSLVSGSDDNTVKTWKGEKITKLVSNIIKTHKGPVNAVWWLKNDKIISASDDKTLAFTNSLGSPESFEKTAHEKRVYALAPSPDGTYVLSGGNDSYICLWNLTRTGEYQKLESAHSEPIRAIAWSKSGNYVISSSNDCTINLRNFDTIEKLPDSQVERLSKEHNDFMYGANISGNNVYAVGGSTDTTVGFWRLSDRTFVNKSTAHKGFVWNVSSSPKIDGRYYVATSSSDGTVKIWDVSDPKADAIEPVISLPVIPESDMVGCDFSGVIIQEEDLKELIIANGGVF